MGLVRHQPFGDDRAKDGIAQEFQPLIFRGVGPARFRGIGPMGQRGLQSFRLLENMSQPGLQFLPLRPGFRRHGPARVHARGWYC